MNSLGPKLSLSIYQYLYLGNDGYGIYMELLRVGLRDLGKFQVLLNAMVWFFYFCYKCVLVFKVRSIG